MADFYTAYPPLFWRMGRAAERPAAPTSRQQGWWSWDTAQAFLVDENMDWSEVGAGAVDFDPIQMDFATLKSSNTPPALHVRNATDTADANLSAGDISAQNLTLTGGLILLAGNAGQVWTDANGNGQGSWQDVPEPPASPMGFVGEFRGWSRPNLPSVSELAAGEEWAWANGQAISRTTYATLFGYIGTTYGAGDGSLTFNLPNLAGRFPLGENDMGGQASGYGALPAGTAEALGAIGGAHEHTLTINQMPSHNHGIPMTNWAAQDYTRFAAGEPGGVATSRNSYSRGGSLPHNTMPPYVTIGYIMRVK